MSQVKPSVGTNTDINIWEGEKYVFHWSSLKFITNPTNSRLTDVFSDAMVLSFKSSVSYASHYDVNLDSSPFSITLIVQNNSNKFSQAFEAALDMSQQLMTLATEWSHNVHIEFNFY